MDVLLALIDLDQVDDKRVVQHPHDLDLLQHVLDVSLELLHVALLHRLQSVLLTRIRQTVADIDLGEVPSSKQSTDLVLVFQVKEDTALG